MKALVKYGLEDGDVEVRDVAEPVLLPGTVLVSARAVGVCGSDIHMWRNGQSWDVALPVTLGHETAGVIAAVADDVTGWQVGDRVVCETAASICGSCALCRTGRYNLCPERQGYGAVRDGAFGELLLAEPRVLHRIPDTVSFEQAAMTEPFAVAFNALVERASVTPGDLVVIQGAGAIGALSLLIAKLRGAGTTVVLGTPVDEHRLATLRGLGADHTLDITKEDPVELIRSLGDGNGADLVVDATGVSVALKQALELVRPFGSIAKVGWGPQPLNFSLDPLVAKAVTLYGSFSHTWTTWERVLSLFASGALDTSAVLGGVYELADWERAFEDMESGRNIKSVMVMPG
ncbi:zinc-dependent alcohol dehydrogenase [Agromyces aerolatus]|uniref:zinc-dependent alcohol dehydrogenase n=1 Tax=Agromyces sp. LY-1074 TaxID=3074080 RepID=UPI00285B3CA4|nr:MULTISPECIES: zinc-binding dehydrogenase [unclassified Agromyces]MDR5701105.1 zinc-binding dehydrogenase [Agromyces sp. LY-1074]MDR5707745.1 zinc-binding dehydrogenase [Agromyces sp. LY-1358]